MTDRNNLFGKQPGEKPEGKYHYNPGNQSGKEGAEPVQSESPVDRVRAASRRLTEANSAAGAPGISFETLAGWVRRAPLKSLAIALMIGVVVAQRR